MAVSLAALAEVARRRLYLKLGHSSLAAYAQRELKHSETSAYRHAQAAWLVCEFPELLTEVQSGAHTLDSLVLTARAFRDHERQVSGTAARERSAAREQTRLLQPGLALELRPGKASMPEPDGRAALSSPLVTDSAAAPASTPASVAAPTAGPTSTSAPAHAELTRAEKRSVLQSVASKPRAAVEKTLARVRVEGVAAIVAAGPAASSPAIPRTRPKARLSAFDGTWSELKVYLSDEESAKLQHLRSLLSSAQPDLDLNALLIRMLEQALDRVDPVRQELRAQARKARAVARANGKARWAADEIKSESPLESPLESRLNLPPPSAQAPEENGGGADAGESADAGASADADAISSSTAPLPPPDDALFRHMAKHCGKPRTEGARRPKQRTRPAPAIPAATVRLVRVRDGNQCQYPVRDPLTGTTRPCGSPLYTQIDHILERRNGGGNEPTNLRVVCAAHNCNRMWLERKRD